MADTTTRTMRLLSLLQRRRYWAGSELAERLDISDRTLRRDIDRLRDLGYTVDSDRGVAGGYRLAGTTGDVALLLEDDETMALAVALHANAGESSELAEASLGALTKVLSMLRPQQRAKVEAIRAATSTAPKPAALSPPLNVLDAAATSCRDHVRLAFDYVSAAAVATRRYVEPHRIVIVGLRWYLVAYDNDRDAWRTFRLDRITNPEPARNSFQPRTAPADDLQRYVRSNIHSLATAHQVVVDADVDADQVRHRYGHWVAVDELGPGRCRLTMEADSFLWPTHIVMALAVPFAVVSPAAFKQHLSAVAAELGYAGSRSATNLD